MIPARRRTRGSETHGNGAGGPSTAARERLAIHPVRRGIGPAAAGLARQRSGGTSQEKKSELPDGVGDIHGPIIVEVGCVPAGETRLAREEGRQDLNGVTEIDHAVVVRLAAAEDRYCTRERRELDQEEAL